MNRSVFGWVAAVVLAFGGAAFAWVFWFAGGSGEPTTQLTTPELAATTTSVPVVAEDSTTSSTSATGRPLTFVIDQSVSEARFELDEVLRGTPTHVVGTTDQVAGQVRFDPADLSTVELSDIVVNARTLTTDSERRDRAVRGPVILDSASDDHELITFVPTEVIGLPDSVESGVAISFEVLGDLTIRGVTQPTTFSVSARLGEDATLVANAEATVLRSDFGIGIPSVPGVADVTDEVLIALDFTARQG